MVIGVPLGFNLAQGTGFKESPKRSSGFQLLSLGLISMRLYAFKSLTNSSGSTGDTITVRFAKCSTTVRFKSVTNAR